MRCLLSCIVQVKGKGLIRQTDESSKLTVRRLDAPDGLIAMLRARRERTRHGDDDPLFPAVRGGWRDPSNTGADLRDFLKWAGFEGLKSSYYGRRAETNAATVLAAYFEEL